MKVSRILVPLTGLALVLLGLALPGPSATAAATPTATVGEVVCVETDGTLTVELHAGDSDPATFTVLLDGSSVSDDTEVAAGGSDQVAVTGLEDGDHSVEVLAAVGDAEPDTVATADVSVACDVAPDGPYTNVRGEVYDGCEYTGVVSASNKVIAGDAEDLQPVEFEVVFTPTDDPTDDPTGDPGDGSDSGDGGTEVGSDGSPRLGTVGVEEVLASFTLDAGNQTYDSTFELGTTGDLVLRTGETVVASAHIARCEVVAVENTAGGGQALPDTGF
jgi:hypothetical protein